MPILLGPATCVSQALSADETLACCSQDIRICHAGVADWRVTRLLLLQWTPIFQGNSAPLPLLFEFALVLPTLAYRGGKESK